MIDPQPGDEGRQVIYMEPGTHPGRKVESGVISSWNAHCVFVRYCMGSTAASTRREDLEWAHEKV